MKTKKVILVDTSGKNTTTAEIKLSPKEVKKRYMREYYKRPEVIARRKSPDKIAHKKELDRIRNARPEVKEHQRERQRRYRLQKRDKKSRDSA